MENKLGKLRVFSKILCLLTLFLIFVGALVKSMDAGLSVPDWPTTYGRFMFAFPLDQMVGGIKYEHTHRMLASIVGLLTLILCVWLWKAQVGLWQKRLGLAAFILVAIQGLLGGLTVKFQLPVWLSTLHGVSAQTFLLVLMMIAYGLSMERQHRKHLNDFADTTWIRLALFFMAVVYIQLIVANWMRHSEAGLAVPDFPSMGGTLIPTLDQGMLDRINAWRFNNNMEEVTMGQVYIHLLHRLFALIILFVLFFINHLAIRRHLESVFIMKTLFWINVAVGIQIMLGISTVLLKEEPIITTIHVTLGAFVLAASFLLILRSSPTSWESFLNQVRPKRPIFGQQPLGQTP